jgi:hypothetical protein
MRLGAAALVWSAGLVLAALMWPAYSTSTASSDGVTLGGHATLVDVNGARALALMAIPLVLTVVVLAALRARRSGRRWGGPLAWVAIGLLTAEALVGFMSIGVFIVPTIVLLTMAVRRAPGGTALASARGA